MHGTREICMHLAILIEHACVLAAKLKWTTWNWLFKSGKEYESARHRQEGAGIA